MASLLSVLFVALCVAGASAHPHSEFPEYPDDAPRHSLPTDPVVTGSGDWKYQLDVTKLTLPSTVSLRNGHGLAKDHEGNIFFTYESTSVNAATRAIVRFNPDGTNGTLVGSDNALAYGTPHGLRISFEGPDNKGYLYHANNHHTIHKTDLDGNILWTTNMTNTWPTQYPQFWPIRPTDSIVPPDSKTVFLSDGYGSSFVHGFDTTTGAYLNGSSFGGKGDSTGPQKFSCPHGINYDSRASDVLLISDRANHRLQWVHRNGTHIRTVDMGPGSPGAAAGQLPCNVDVHGDISLVPGLDGPVGILDNAGTVLSVLEVGKLLPKTCPHPHDAIMLDNKDVIVCCWAPGLITYWKHLD